MYRRQVSPTAAVSRRGFLRTAAASTFAMPFLLPSGLRAAAPNSKLCHACIGVTRMGGNDLGGTYRDGWQVS